MEIELPNGTILDAPDGLSPEQIKTLVKNYTAKNPMPEDRSKWGAAEKINNVVNQLGTGVFKGLAGLAALPRVFSDLTADNSAVPHHPVAGRGIPGAERHVQTMIEAGAPNAGQSLPGFDDIIRYLEMLPGLKMAPAETRADKFLQAGGQGAAAIVAPGGVLPNFVGGVTGSLASEGAGQLTEGTQAEPYARIAAGLAGGLTGSAVTNRAAASNVEQLINKATAGATADDWAAAMRLQSDAAQRGAPITSAEALAQAMGGNRTLQSIQRTVEQMPETAPKMDAFMAARPATNAQAIQSQLDSLSPQSAAPFEVGPTVQKAAQQSIELVRKQINQVTDDAYRWGTDQLIPPAEFAPISENPIFQHFANQVRKDPLLGPSLANLDENSVAFVNAVKKEMDEVSEGFTDFASQNKSPERAMRVEQAQSPMVEAAKKTSPLYDEALSEQARLRGSKLEPMKRGATGQLAAADDWKAQARIIMSDTPGAEKEVAAAVKNVSQTAPDAIPELIRMKLESVFNSALPNAKGVNEQFRGANFASLIEKNPQSIKSLEAAIKALPNGETQWTGFRRLLDVFEAQGQRLPAGSPTSFNQQLAGDLSRNLGKGVKSLGTDMWANWNIQRRSQELARILTDPEGVALLRRLAVLGPNSAKAQQLVQAFYQGGQAGRPSLEQTRQNRAIPQQ